MAVATKKTASKKTPAKKATEPEAPVVVEMSEARKQARKRQVESRSRAVQEKGLDPKTGEIVIYELKNRTTGQTRELIDARGAVHESGLDWVVRDPATKVEKRYKTRKELGADYAHADLSAPEPAKKVRAKKAA